MNTVEDIINEWKKDCQLDDLNLDKENLRIPSLHAKYLAVLIGENKKMRGLRKNMAKLKLLLRCYYLGEATEADLNTLNREQYQKRVLKNELSDYLDNDSMMINLNLQIDAVQEKIDVLREILKSLNNRGYQLRNAIDWHRLTMGG